MDQEKMPPPKVSLDIMLIDPTPVLCLEKRCPTVIGDALVYRNEAHFTPTYVRTLASWLGERLPKQIDPQEKAVRHVL